MSTDAGSAAAPEDAATREVASERPGLESADPGSADSATSTPETVDRGVEGSAASVSGSGPDMDTDSGAGGATGAGTGTAPRADGDRTVGETPDAGSGTATGGARGANPADEGFVAGLLRDATVTGLPGETGAPPAEPHAPQAQQQGDEPVGSEPRVGDNPRGVD